MSANNAPSAAPSSRMDPPAAGGSSSAASPQQQQQQQSKRGRSNSSRGSSANGGGHQSHHHGHGGWIQVGRNGKPVSHRGSSSGGGSNGGPARDPVSVVAAAASAGGRWKRHGPRVVRQPAHPHEPRRSSARSSGDETQPTIRLSANARRRLKRRQRRIEHAAALAAASSAASSEDSVDGNGAAAAAAGAELDESLHRDMPTDDLSPGTGATSSFPTPSTLPRGGSGGRFLSAPAAHVALRPLVRCTDGATTYVRTLHDIMRSTAPDYNLEADTPVVKPAAAAGGSAMPSLALGDTCAPAAAADSGGMEQRHPSSNDISEGYHAMHHHELAAAGGAAGAAASAGGTPGSDGAAPSNASFGTKKYLTLPPSAFTVDSIATPNTYYSMPHAPVPPPMPVKLTYQQMLSGYDERTGSFAWHATEESRAAFAAQLLTLCDDVAEVLRARPLLRKLEAPAYVLGDIHGNYADLSFFLKSFLVMNDIQLTPCQILCLGDYVDRGPASVECVALLFALCLEAPDRVVLLRGNHEDRVVCGDHRVYGDDCFWGQCCRHFDSELGTRVFRCVTRVFKELPLACELTLPEPNAPRILCTHGGFPRFTLDEPETFHRLDLLRRDDFPRFLTLFPNNPLAHDDSGPDEDLPDFVEAAWFTAFDLLWSDPTSDETDSTLDENGFCCNMRGLNVMSFSQRAVEEYLRASGYAMLFRAHQEKQFGLRVSKSSKVLTLFSSSNYQGHGNGAGCAIVDSRGHVQLVMKS